MPYQTEDYNPPSLPEIRQIRSFEEVRDAVNRIMQYLAHLQSSHVQYFQHLRENMNQASTTQGADLVAQDPLVPTHFMHVVTGGGTVTTIVHPRNHVGHLMLVAQDGFMLDAGGNIQLITAPNFLKPNAHINLTWLPSKNVWYTDSCRLQNSLTTLRVGNRTVVTE